MRRRHAGGQEPERPAGVRPEAECGLDDRRADRRREHEARRPSCTRGRSSSSGRARRRQRALGEIRGQMAPRRGRPCLSSRRLRARPTLPWTMKPSERLRWERYSPAEGRCGLWGEVERRSLPSVSGGRPRADPRTGHARNSAPPPIASASFMKIDVVEAPPGGSRPTSSPSPFAIPWSSQLPPRVSTGWSRRLTRLVEVGELKGDEGA